MSKNMYLVTGRDPVTLGSSILGAFCDEETATAAVDIFRENDTSLQDLDIASVTFYGDEVPLLKSMYLLRAGGTTGIIDTVVMPEDTPPDYSSSEIEDDDGTATTVLYALTDTRESIDKITDEIRSTLEAQDIEFDVVDHTTEEM